MSLWLIVPRDPLIFRDGKPFTATPGERSKSLGFPFPSTLAGAVRTRSGTNPQESFDVNRIGELLTKSVRGPLLVELDADGKIAQHYFPAPADALLVDAEEDKAKDEDKVQCYALAPINPPPDALTDLTDLALVGHVPHVKEKPYHKAPRHWNWGTMQSWLMGAFDTDKPIDPKTIGLEDLPREHRTHVSIDPAIQASREGALFQTSGMEFLRAELNAEKRVKDAHSLALAIETDATLKEGADFLGGERRVVRWQKTQEVMPKCPDAIKQKIIAQKHCRLILATPAYFEKDYLPSRLQKDFNIKIIAAALSRYQTISGWDYAKENGGAPKPTRRLVPAGSVYFLNLKGVADIEAFVNAVWLQAISDDDQSRLDGFGLALLGAWDGVMRNMEALS